MSKEMELIIRGKDIYGNSKSKSSLIKCLQQEIEYILNLPEEATIENSGDDYITFYVENKILTGIELLFNFLAIILYLFYANKSN